MAQTRRKMLSKLRIRGEDAEDLAKEFEKMGKVSQRSKRRHVLRLEVCFADGVEIQGDRYSILLEDGDLDRREVVSLFFTYEDYQADRKVSFRLHRDWPESLNELEVRGKDKKWVSTTFNLLEERIEQCETNFKAHVFYKYVELFGTVSGIVLGLLTCYVILKIFGWWDIGFVALVGLSGVIGMGVGAACGIKISSVARAGYPDIELDMGGEHSRPAANARKKLRGVTKGFLLPIGLTLVAELILVVITVAISNTGSEIEEPERVKQTDGIETMGKQNMGDVKD